MIDPANYNFKIQPRILSKEEILEHSLPLTDSTMTTDIIKETQEHIKRLDSAMVKYDEYVGLLQGSKRLLQRNMEYLQKHLTEPPVESEENVVHYVGFNPAQYPLEGLNYKSHDSLYLNVELFRFHRKEGDIVYGTYSDIPVIVDTAVQLFCHFATFESTTVPADKVGYWSKTGSAQGLDYLFYGFKTIGSKDATGAVTTLYPGTVFKISVLNSMSGIMLYQRHDYNYYGTELVESPPFSGFFTIGSL